MYDDETDELEREMLDAAEMESYFADMENMSYEMPTVSELADMAQRYDVECPF